MRNLKPLDQYDAAMQKLHEALNAITEIRDTEDTFERSDKYSKECYKSIITDMKGMQGYLSMRQNVIERYLIEEEDVE